MDDLIKRAREEYEEGDWSDMAVVAVWAQRNAEALLSHAEAQASALVVAREKIERMTREINGYKDALAQADGMIAQLNALEALPDASVNDEAIAAFIRQQGYIRLEFTLDSMGGYDATYYSADAFDR